MASQGEGDDFHLGSNLNHEGLYPMIEADSVHSTPPLSSSSIPEGTARQQAERTQAVINLTRLRNEARQEINRLIDFLDESDPYVMTELADDDDREEVGDSEPSLGSFDRMTDQEKSYQQG